MQVGPPVSIAGGLHSVQNGREHEAINVDFPFRRVEILEVIYVGVDNAEGKPPIFAMTTVRANVVRN